MKLFKAPPKAGSIITILLIVLILYPFINLLRGYPYRILAVSVHVKEFVFLAVSLFVIASISFYIHRKISNSAFFGDRTALQILIEIFMSFIYTLLFCIPFFILLFPEFLRKGKDFRTATLFTIIVFLIQLAFLFYHHFSDYLIRFKKAIMREEKLRYENMAAQYRALQNHISPHFLFNCLSGLDTTIHKNPSQASSIVHNLSDCLRYIISTHDKTTVPLDAELTFIRTYHHLLNIRIPGSIILANFIDEADMHKQIPPCLLQILMENVVKHNDATPEQPVTVSFTSLPGNKLEVSNTIIRKINPVHNSITGTGLENIKGRYSLLTDQKIDIQKNGSTFTVILPLLEKSMYENNDHRK